MTPPPPQLLDRDVWRLLDVSVALEKHGLDEYLQRVLEAALEWFEASGASLFLKLEEHGPYRLAAQTGACSQIPAHATVTPGKGIAGYCMQEGRAMLVRDPRDEPSLKKSVKTVRAELNSAMVVPLTLLSGGCLGVLNLSRRVGLPAFGEPDLAQATAIGRQIALGVGNALLLASETKAKEKLRLLLDTLPAAVFLLDSEQRLTDANESAKVLAGSAAGRTLEEIVAQMADSLRSPLLHAYSEALEGRRDHQTVSDAGEDRHWTVSSWPLDHGAVLELREITRRVRQEREASRLKRLAEIGQMTAAIAHDLRNPLTGIRSAAQMMVQAPEHSAEFAEIIEQEVLKLNRLCDDFLEFARPLSLRLSTFSLNELLRNLALHHKPRFRQAGVKLELQIDASEPTITADRLRLEQVLHNLLLNALQACERGGQVTLVGESNGFKVVDTGKGLDAAALTKLFTPFYTTKAAGTGLGLSNVKKIIDAHGGTIDVNSERGEGATFRVWMGGSS